LAIGRVGEKNNEEGQCKRKQRGKNKNFAPQQNKTVASNDDRISIGEMRK
jgi:hypothetical protein